MVLAVLSVGIAPRAAAAAPGVPAAVQRYAPYIYLAPGERYLPADAGNYVANSSLAWSRDGNCPDDTVADVGAVDPAKLGGGGYQHRIASSVCIDHGRQWRSNDHTRPRDAKPGVPEREGFFLQSPDRYTGGQSRTAPAYFEYHPHQYVTYWFFYNFNDAPGPTNFFDHQGDWERITVRLDKNDRATAVAYFQHTESCVVPWGQAGKHDGRPLAYSALGTHATYPSRFSPTALADGLASDTIGRGDAWSTAGHLLNARTQPWFGFGGAWGQVGSTPDSTGPLGPSRFKGAVPRDWSKQC
ncbi:hypothetical protein [Parafrankia discariae]|uniref:hypothetical protein n=1 Tax=Parafrankia discariae TaxID=365528 RepID=UPI0003677EE9|nr:hypothetical protein [Parafrankia discariae]